MKKFYYEIVLRAMYLKESLKRMREIHLMDHVMVDGVKYFVNNGIGWNSEYNETIYDLVEAVPYYDGRKCISVRQSLIKKCKTFRNLKHGALYYYKFCMVNWHKINMSNAIITGVVEDGYRRIRG